LWPDSLVDPAVHAGWILIDDVNEGGDILARHRRAKMSLLNSFEKVCDGGGVTLYRRVAPALR